ncbi:MAG TPA: hypothetical protein VFJ09_05145 [Nocardioidaceae bacterium]|nr:hypothetical protein [Nocardioidaceae bacterium]
MDQRDRDLTTARGLRRVLVATGVAGSLGFAALAAASTGTTGSISGAAAGRGAVAPARVGATGSGAGLLPGLTGDDGGQENGDDGRPARAQRVRHRRPPSAVPPGPGLLPGSGPAQATTSGS